MVAQELLDGIKHLGNGVGYLFKGEFDNMLVSLLNGAFVVGIFLIIMFLVKFVLEITIFKSDEHKKYSTWMAVGIALIGILNDSLVVFIYRVLGGSFPLILLLLLVVFAIIIFVNKLRKHNYESLSEMRSAATEATVARKDLRKEDHDLSLQEKMEKRELGAIVEAERIVDHELLGARNLHQLVERLRELLGQLAQVTDQAQAQQLRDSILKGSQALPNLIKEEYVDEEKLTKLLQKLKQELYADIKLDGKEQLEFNHLHEHLARQLAEESKLNIGSSRTKLMSKESEAKLHQFLARARQLDEQRATLLKEIEAIDTTELSQTQQLRNLVTQLIQSLNAGDSNSALSHLANIEQLINTETAESRKLKELLLREQQLTQQKLQLDMDMHQLVRQFANLEKQEGKHISQDEHKDEHNFRVIEEKVRIIKEMEEQGDTMSVNHQAAQRNLQQALEQIKRDHATNIELLTKIRQHLRTHHLSVPGWT
jgi:hypothetical protein